MKKAALILMTVFALTGLTAQNLNDKGLYVDSDGQLFSGMISKTSDGMRSELNVKEGVIEGPAVYYYASGKVMETGGFTKGQKDQKWTRYSEAGKISAIAFYNLGKKTGTWLVYDEQGTKRFEMVYVDGRKTGIWSNWDEKGNLIQTKDYGKLN
jgi:antitoxin component YwqK of YwqJK toxin-antitoxin module